VREGEVGQNQAATLNSKVADEGTGWSVHLVIGFGLKMVGGMYCGGMILFCVIEDDVRGAAMTREKTNEKREMRRDILAMLGVIVR